MNTAVDAVTLTVATGSAECAPVTEFFNANAPAASQDQIFFGVQTLGSGADVRRGWLRHVDQRDGNARNTGNPEFDRGSERAERDYRG